MHHQLVVIWIGKAMLRPSLQGIVKGAQHPKWMHKFEHEKDRTELCTGMGPGQKLEGCNTGRGPALRADGGISNGPSLTRGSPCVVNR
jgi:hypothetical protein